MKRIIALCLSLVFLFMLVSCSGGESKKETIGIIRFGSHKSLNNCYDGIIEGLKENGINAEDYNIECVDSNFDANVSLTQANKFVNSKAKVIVAIATPSAIAAANACFGTDIPVVYCAVTDPSVMDNYQNVTGSSDIPDFEKQIETVKAFINKSEIKIGVLYSTEESSSPVQIDGLKKAAEKLGGVKIVPSAVSDITTIDTKVNSLVSDGVDCLLNILDNTIVGKLETNILPITNEKKIPVFGSEIEQVKAGCIATDSIEYVDVGRKAGESCAKILKGEKASDIPVAVVTEPKRYYNSEVCSLLGIKLPDIEATDVIK